MYKLLKKVKEINPLVLNYTNNVTITDCANTTLAIGASPLMSFSYEEVDDIVKVASSVVINIGTMNSELLDLYVLAGKTANKYNKPVILDPVGVFATKARTDLTNKLLNEVAKKRECIVVASGKTDVISDGNKIYKISNGTPKLKFITGTGCMSTSLIGSFLPCTEDKIDAAVMGTLVMSLCGELANRENPAIGSFKTKLFDEIFTLNEETCNKYGKIELAQLNSSL